MTLTACAPSHRDVATTLVRLKSLHGTEEVKLTDSTANESTNGAAGSSAPAPSAGSGDAACGAGKTDFHATVVFKPGPSLPQVETKVPASLGGGS